LMWRRYEGSKDDHWCFPFQGRHEIDRLFSWRCIH